MSNNDTEQELSLKEIMNNANLAVGLDLDISIGQYEEVEVESKVEPETVKTVATDGEKYNGEGFKPFIKPPMKISCKLEIGIGRENKIIYVCPGKAQYFTATALHCCGDAIINIEYDGQSGLEPGQVLPPGPGPIIYGCLGYYRIIKSGIIFLPYHTLTNYPEGWYPGDILSFKATDRCKREIKFDVVFTYSRCVDCGCDK